jgi:hypothetical protein
MKELCMSPYIIVVVLVLAALFTLLSLTAILAEASDGDASDLFAASENDPAPGSLSR